MSEISNKGVLDTGNHDRDSAGMTYVYPVISRRAGGVSIGVNLNPNHACNWHCAYCQVPDLRRGSAPDIDISILISELRNFLHVDYLSEFMRNRVPEACRKISDVAISGNGEPTSSRQFDTVVQAVVDCLGEAGLLDSINIVLISNGSYVHRQEVQHGLGLMARHRGQVWFKLDAASDEAIGRINGVSLSADRQMHQLQSVATCCPTWIQTCMFAWDGMPPEEDDIQDYLHFLGDAQARGIGLEGVLLYGLARPSLQPEAVHLSRLPEDWMRGFAERIESTGLAVRLSL